MSRPRANLSPTGARLRGRSWAEPLLAAVLVVAALLLIVARGDAAALRVAPHSGPSLHAGSPAQLVDAAPRRVDAQVRRDRVRLDLPPLPLASAPPGARPFRDLRRVIAVRRLGPGREPARDLRLSHFRRRIPRMNSEEPPCG